MRPAALLLDLDGTLVDSEPLHRRGYRAFLDARGWDVPDLSVFTGRRAEDVVATEPGPWEGHDPDALLAEVITHVPDEAAVAVPGSRDLLLAARAVGVRLAVVTSAKPAWVERSLVESLGLSLAAVDLVVTALDVVDGKPDPAGYVLAADRLGVDAALTIAVEDSPAGVLAALGAGVGHVVGITTTHGSALLEDAGAHATVPDLRPVVERVRRRAS